MLKSLYVCAATAAESPARPAGLSFSLCTRPKKILFDREDGGCSHHDKTFAIDSDFGSGCGDNAIECQCAGTEAASAGKSSARRASGSSSAPAPQRVRPQRRAPHRQRVRPQRRGSRRNARLRKGQPLRNTPRKEPQRQRARPRRARCNIRLRKGQPRRNEQQLQRVRPHHAPLIHRLGQRRRRPARLCRPLQPQHQRARSCAASNARSAHYARKKLVNCEPFRLRSARRNSRKSISSVSSARSSGYSLTSRRSRKA